MLGGALIGLIQLFRALCRSVERNRRLTGSRKMKCDVASDDSPIQRLDSDMLSLVLLKTLLIKTSADDGSHLYTVYVTLTSVSRGWRRMIIGQPWFHAPPTQPVIHQRHDVDEHDSPSDLARYDDHVVFEDEFLRDVTGDEVDAVTDDDGDYEELVLNNSPLESVKVHDKLLLVINEIISTEKTYIKRLRLLNKNFRQELESQNRVKKMVSEVTMNDILSNIDSIYKLHIQLLKQLLQQPLNETQCRVGGVFCTLAQYLKMYAVYLNNVEPCRRLITQLRRRSRGFDDVIKRLEQRADFERLKVDSLLQEPIARIPRYELLLKQYLKYLPKNSFDRRDTERAIEMVHKAAVHANDYLHQSAQKRRLVELAGKLRSSDPSFTIVRPGCRLVSEETVRTANLTGNGEFSDRTALLFTDHLLMCDGFFYVTERLSLNGMKVLNEDSPLTVTIKAQQSAVELAFCSEAKKSEWIQVVTGAIDEYAKARHSLLRSFTALAKSIAYSRDELGVMAPIWTSDEDAELCMVCGLRFGWIVPRRHHCRACGSVVCGGCSRQCAPLAYRAYRRSRVCDNCDLILRHKTQPGFRCHDNASSAAGPLTPAAAARDVEYLCSATIDDELIARNNQPLCSNVGANALKSMVSGYLAVGQDQTLEESSRRWFELHRNGVLYSFSRLTSSEATTATVLHGYSMVQRRHCTSADAEADWQFALVRGQRTMFYFLTDNSQQLERWTKELATTARRNCPLVHTSSLIEIAVNAIRMFLS